MTILLKAFVSFAVLGRRFWAPLLLLPLISSGASATIQFSGWYYTSITGPFAGESALVAAGILYDTVRGTAGAPTYDYIYEVADTGTAPIAAFVGGTGPQGAVLYNSDTSFGLPGLPASGPVSRGAMPGFLTQVPPAQAGKRLLGGWGGANNPFRPSAPATPYTPLYPGSRGLTSPNYQYWGFEVSSTGAGYLLGWYNLVGNQIFGHGLVTRFDLNSINGPVAGGAFVDPPSSSDYYIDWSPTQFEMVPTPSIPNPETTFCSPTDPQCNPLAIPSEIAALNYTGFGAVPEASTWAMMLMGFGGLALAAYRRGRGLASRPMLG